MLRKYTSKVANTRVIFTGNSQKQTLIDKTINFTWCLVCNFRRSCVCGLNVFHTVISAYFHFETLAVFDSELYEQRTLIAIQLHFIQYRRVSRLIHLVSGVSHCLFTDNPTGVHNSRELVLNLFDFTLRGFKHLGETGVCLLHFRFARR